MAPSLTTSLRSISLSLSLFSVGVNCVRRVKWQTVTQPKWSQFTRTIKRLIFLTRFPFAPSLIPFCNNHMIMLISCILVLALLPQASTPTSLDEHMKHPNQKHAPDSREQKCVTKCLSHDVSTNSVDGDTTQFPETWRRRPKRFCAPTRYTCHMHLKRTPRSDTGLSSGNFARMDNLTRSVVKKKAQHVHLRLAHSHLQQLAEILAITWKLEQ